MVLDGFILGHKVSSKSIEVDKAKIEVIEQIPPPISVKGIISFLSHDFFYHMNSLNNSPKSPKLYEIFWKRICHLNLTILNIKRENGICTTYYSIGLDQAI